MRHPFAGLRDCALKDAVCGEKKEVHQATQAASPRLQGPRVRD